MRIKFSERGLTFSFRETPCFKAGTHYRYLIDTVASEIIIMPDETGKYRFSRKGEHEKPLVDLRNSEIREAISHARYMDVSVEEDQIVVHIIKSSVSIDTLSEVDLSELIGKSDRLTFEINKEHLCHDNGTLYDVLDKSGLFTGKVRDDLCYVFDTVSLFSGAGLLDLPFKKDEAFDIRFAIDFDKSACETYRANIGDHIKCMDIRELDEKSVPDTDLIIGGPCCQGYSNSNRAGNIIKDISKRLLIDDYIRIVRAKRPLMFVIENVRQFLTKECGRYLERVLSGLSDYNITYSVVNDSNLGGYSKRDRMILIGSSKEVGKVIIPDIKVSQPLTVRDALKNVTTDWFNYNDVTTPSEDTARKMAMVRPGHNFKDIPELMHLDRHSNTYRRLCYDEPSVTITNWRKVNLMPPVGNRILTVSEAAAIMGLDSDFRFYGSLNDRQQCVGNGVTQAIANFVKDIVKRYLSGYAESLITSAKKHLEHVLPSADL